MNKPFSYLSLTEHGYQASFVDLSTVHTIKEDFREVDGTKHLVINLFTDKSVSSVETVEVNHGTEEAPNMRKHVVVRDLPVTHTIAMPADVERLMSYLQSNDKIRYTQGKTKVTAKYVFDLVRAHMLEINEQTEALQATDEEPPTDAGD